MRNMFVNVDLLAVQVISATYTPMNPWVGSLILAQSHTLLEIDHEKISTVILLPSSDSRCAVVSYKRKYMHKLLLVNPLVQLALEKMCEYMN